MSIHAQRPQIVRGTANVDFAEVKPPKGTIFTRLRVQNLTDSADLHLSFDGKSYWTISSSLPFSEVCLYNTIWLRSSTATADYEVIFMGG